MTSAREFHPSLVQVFSNLCPSSVGVQLKLMIDCCRLLVSTVGEKLVKASTADSSLVAPDKPKKKTERLSHGPGCFYAA